MIDVSERKWKRLLLSLDRHPLDQWSCFGLLGEPELYPMSLYKLCIHRRAPRALCWLASVDFGSSSFDPVAHQRKLYSQGGGLSEQRQVHGELEVLRDYTCHPDQPALVRLLAELQRRISH